MDEINSFTHLTFGDRLIINTGIERGASKTSIAITIGKDNSTVGKEIKLHRVVKHKCSMPLECSRYRKCAYGRQCTTDCPDYEPFKCNRRDRSPGACNGCPNWSRCRFDKIVYDPHLAQKAYQETLVDARQGVNLTYQEAKEMAQIVTPLLKQGQSPYMIVSNHPELGICEKTLYNYIESGVFQEITGVAPLDLRRQVSRKLPKARKQQYKKREDRAYLKGRLFSDYKQYREDHPDTFVAQMDTVYNDETNGPFIQTFKFLETNLLLALLHDRKTAQEMKHGIDLLEHTLGVQVFRKFFPVLLTDRGTEFTDPDGMEASPDGCRRTRVFYCDPQRSDQKGSLENNHIALRYVLLKNVDLTAIGLTDQTKLNLILSHVNSMPVEKLGGKTPLELTEFLYPDFFQQLCSFGLRKIKRDEVNLTPRLLK